MIYIFRNSLLNRLKFIWGAYLILIGLIISIFVVGLEPIYVISIGALYFSTILFPTVYLHLQYAFKSAYVKIVVDSLKEEVRYCRKDEVFSFSLKDINLIEQFKTPPVAENRWPWFPWATYNYSKIHFIDGRTLIITCFLINELALNISNEKIKLRIVFFPYIRD